MLLLTSPVDTYPGRLVWGCREKSLQEPSLVFPYGDRFLDFCSPGSLPLPTVPL